MKITGIESYSIWNGFVFHTVVVVDTEDGLYGLGEMGVAGREVAQRGLLEHFREMLVGEDARRIEHLWQRMTREGFFPPGAIASSVVSAIDVALWDVKAKSFGVPLYELLGGRVRDSVACYTHCGARDGRTLVEDCQWAVEQGWRHLRFEFSRGEDGVFEPVPAARETLRALEEIRTAVGDDVEILVDVHTRLDPADARWFCRNAEQYRPFFVEDPLRSENPQALRQLRASTSVPLAVGEQYAGKHAFRQVVEENLADYARIDVSIVGGITEARKVAGWCETHYINVATHNPLGPVSSAACLHLNLVTPNFGVHEQPFAPSALRDVFPEHPQLIGGTLAPPSQPGLGVTIDRDAARHYDFRIAHLPTLRRRDGTVTNW